MKKLNILPYNSLMFNTNHIPVLGLSQKCMPNLSNSCAKAAATEGVNTDSSCLTRRVFFKINII